jgi:two-component system chemotaxis response regulator CheY
MGVRTVLGTSDRKSGRLLIVDDSSTIRRSIERHILSDRVTEIYQAANGREAMELFERYRPEFVTMDLTMPEMDGLTCISKMMALKPDTRLMVISALGDAATAIEAVERGANEYVVKPFSARDLNLALANLVAEP